MTEDVKAKASISKAALELFIISAISLYVELLIIRWLSSDIRAFTVFRTFPLISCFVGLGAGMALGNDKINRFFPLAALSMCIMMKEADFLGVSFLAFPSLSVFQWGNLVGLQSFNALYVLLIMLVMIILLGLPFALCMTIGARLGTLFNQLEALPAYSYNILGAITGSILFQLLVCLGLAPQFMLLLPLLIVLLLQLKERKPTISDFVPFVLIPLIFFITPSRPAMPLFTALQTYQTKEAKTLWSPYQRLDLSVLESKPEKSDPAKFMGLELSVNHTFYQYFLNTRPDSPISDSKLIDAIRKDYALPFTFNKAKSVLIVGAGTGQNVSFALAAGANDIDAVEIDPVIFEIGKKYNQDYASDKVNMVCDDARHFFSRTKKHYDVINFSTLDSHTVSGFGSSVRLDAYVYTKESIAKALSLLNDDGVVVISFATPPWIQKRLYRTFTEAAGYEPLLLEGHFSGSIFVLGPKVKDGTITAPELFNKLKISPDAPRFLTDDWPYLYVQPEVPDYSYLLVMTEILLISLFVTRKHWLQKNDAPTWQMFFLGSAFMLLELHAISFLSLLYGSTWVTSALVINGILIMILLANLLVIKLGAKITMKQPIVYCALLASILVSYFLPAEQLLNSVQSDIAYPLLTIFTILPMGVAAIIFSSAFSKVSNASRALAFNLFGAVVGGLLEYLSNYLGIRNLLLVAAGLYFCSYLCFAFKKQVK